ncbi:MAG: GGDEF domain-containing protein, partial [Candidatus Nanopelagicales bacterium]|nr:GGDEF domain-containing protein [Candidatus Nanopelagicales bacterium]
MSALERNSSPEATRVAEGAFPRTREPSDDIRSPEQRAQESLVDTGAEITQHVLDSLPDRTALINREGRITTANAAWLNHAEAQGSKAVPGTDYLELLRAAPTKWSREALIGIEAVLHGHLDNFEMDYEFNEYTNGQLSTRAYSTNVLPLLTESGGAIVSQVDITWRKNLERQLSHRATHDGLTDLPNRMMLGDRLEQALARAARTSSRVAVLFCDLDRFKDINDTLGHAVGDQVLVAVARRLRRCCRRSDWVTRFGGDEFVVVMEEVPDQQVVAEIAGRIKEAITAPVVIGEQELYFGVSIGVAIRHGTMDQTAEAVDDLLRDADTAMYRAKEGGRNRIEVFDVEMRERASERLEILPDLHRAVERGQILAYFQPQFSIAEYD